MSKLALDRLVLHTAMMLNRGVAGLVDALEGYDSLRHAAVEQSVFGHLCGQLADRRQPQIDLFSFSPPTVRSAE